MARRSVHVRPILLAALLLPLTCRAGFAGSDEPTPAATEPTRGFSFRPHPLPESRSFAVFDLGIAYRMNKGEGYSSTDSRGCTSLDLGYMRNLSPKNAVGFSAFGLADERTERAGIRARYRRWLSPHFGLDATAGMALGDGSDYIQTPAPIASVGIQASGVVGVTLEAEQIRSSGADVWDWRIGGHLGSGAGVAGAVVLLALTAIFVASYD